MLWKTRVWQSDISSQLLPIWNQLTTSVWMTVTPAKADQRNELLLATVKIGGWVSAVVKNPSTSSGRALSSAHAEPVEVERKTVFHHLLDLLRC
jgi:hypothetical protein